MNSNFSIKLVCVFSLICIIILPGISQAAAQRTVLYLKNLRSDLSLGYAYDAHAYGNKTGDGKLSSVQHTTAGRYGFDFDYALYRPRYWNGIIGATLGFKNLDFDSSATGSGSVASTVKEFETEGVLLERSRTPLRLKASSGTDTIGRRFAKDYDQTSKSYNASLEIRNRVLPASLNYSSLESETDGLLADRSIVSEGFSLSVSHALLTLSETDFDFSTHSSKVRQLDDLTIADESTDAISSTFRNRLTLFPGKVLHLDSLLLFREETGTREVEERVWRESVAWKPGSALTGNVLYEETSEEAYGEERLVTLIRPSLTHRLFHSFTTTVSGHVREEDFYGGTERSELKVLRFDYTKKLKKSRKLSLAVRSSLEDILRDIGSSTVEVPDERITLSPGVETYLKRSDVIVSSIEVRSQIGVLYSPLLDYEVLVFGPLVRIVKRVGGGIADGETVRVKYQYIVNPSVEYTTESLFLSSLLSLNKDKVILYARMLVSDEEKLSGSDDVVNIKSLVNYYLGFKANLVPLSYGADYIDINADDYRSSYLSSFVNYLKADRGTRFVARLQNIYQRFIGISAETTTNRITATAGYDRQLNRRVGIKTTAECQVYTGDGQNHEDYAVEAVINARLGRTRLTLRVKEKFSDYDKYWQRSDHFSLNLSRRF